MTRTIVLSAVVLLLTASQTQAQSNLGYRGYVTFGPTVLSATESFEAVAGKSTQTGIGFGGSVDRIWQGLFVDVGIFRVKVEGERVFVFDGTVFPLDIPLTIELRPIDVIVGWRNTDGRWSPYGGAGFSMMNYKESSPFAEPGDDVDESEIGLSLLGGVDFTATHWLAIGGEVRYRNVTGILGVGGVSQEFGEDQLGGTSFALRVSVGRWAPPTEAEPEPPPRPSVPSRPSLSFPGGETTVAWARLSDSALSDASDAAQLLGQPEITSDSVRGFSVATTSNYTDWFGVTTAVGANFWPQDASDLVQMWTILAGAKFTVRQPSRVKPFAQILVGPAYFKGGEPALDSSFENWDTAVQVGGGMDLVLDDTVAVRVGVDGRIVSDKVFSGETSTQVRFTLGITFFHGRF